MEKQPTHVIIPIEASVGLVLAGTFAQKVCHSAATQNWVRDPIRREQCEMAAKGLREALDLWRKERKFNEDLARPGAVERTSPSRVTRQGVDSVGELPGQGHRFNG